MVTRAQAAKIALALPESVEQDHHGRISFRVAGRIFATLWDEHHTNVMLDAEEIRAATEANPGMCEEFWWGRRLAAVQVDLRRAEPGLIADLYADAWERKAPERLVNPR